MSSFTHLHVHTEYSLLDGVNRSGKLFEHVKNLGMDAVAISDHGVMYGVPEFWKYSKDFGVKPLLGCEIYLAPGDMTVRQEVDGLKYYHLLLLAKNMTGYLNLVKLVTESQLRGMYYKPRVDRETLAKYSEGLICTSACMAGPLSRHILRNEKDKAVDWLKFLQGTFKDDFYIELQRHGYDGSDVMNSQENDMLAQILKSGGGDEVIDNSVEQKHSNLILRELASEFNVPLVATADSHYLTEADRELQTILFCIKDGKLMTDDDCRTGYVGTYILTPEEMERKFADIPEAISNTRVITDKIDSYSIAFDRIQPKFWNIPKHKTAQQIMQEEAYLGAVRKYDDRIIDPTIKDNTGEVQITKIKAGLDPELVERIEYELDVIHNKGYDDYFLVVSDLMRWAASQNILMGVRGSAAGSVIAHCLDIVEVEPIKWELYFERFLNPERPSPPDIDMDIQDDRRDEVINYVKEKYGQDAVAAICSLGRLKTKAAIRDVSRVMGIDLPTADKLSKLVTVLFGKPYKFNKMMETNPEFAQIVNSREELQQMGQYVTKIEEMARHMSVHACGHLITPGPIIDYVPMQYESGGDARVITQYEFMWLEELGLMKFDFLGLRTLTIVNNALENIRRNHNVEIDFYTIPESDAKTYELFGKGETVGVFQFESPPMQQYLRELKPENQEDLCFMAAAYRPGPMAYIPSYIQRKHGKQDTEYVTPELEPIVGKTFGFAIYQEQVIKIAVDIAGYSMGAADILRRAMGKKKVDVMKKEEVVFKEGVMKRGLSEEIADQLWKYLLPFADYGFNKAHAAGYAVLAYKCAYLKAHYPLEFMAALMHSDLSNSERIVIDIEEARRMGFTVVAPDINKSHRYFTVEEGGVIRFGLGAIKNVGVSLCDEIARVRDEQGPFTSLDDFLFKVGPKNINKKALECLIKAGAMDQFGSRNQLMEVMPSVVEKLSKNGAKVHEDQIDLFAAAAKPVTPNKVIATPLPTTIAVESKRERIGWEKELMGVYLSSHPLEDYFWTGLKKGFYTIDRLKNERDGAAFQMVGMINMTRQITTKKDGKPMAFIQIEDSTGGCEAVVFPRVFEIYRTEIKEATPLVFNGKVSFKDDKLSLIIDKILPVKNFRKPDQITINITSISANQHELETLKSFIDPQAGELKLKVLYGNQFNPKALDRTLKLSPAAVRAVSKYIVE